MTSPETPTHVAEPLPTGAALVETPSSAPTATPFQSMTIIEASPIVPTLPITPLLVVEQPSAGAHIAIGQSATFSGFVDPLPQQEMVVSVHFLLDGVLGQNFELSNVDFEDGSWQIDTFIHPEFIGEAELVATASFGTATFPVHLVYDETDEGTYVNFSTPKDRFLTVQVGDTFPIHGTVLNPVDGIVWMRLNEADTDNVWLHEEMVVDAQGQWQTKLVISAEWANKTIVAFACTGAEDGKDATWCSTLYLTVEPAEI